MKKGNPQKSSVRSFEYISELAKKNKGQSEIPADVSHNPQEKACYTTLCQFYSLLAKRDQKSETFQEGFSNLIQSVCSTEMQNTLNSDHRLNLFTVLFYQIYEDPILMPYFTCDLNDPLKDKKQKIVDDFTYIMALSHYQKKDNTELTIKSLVPIINLRWTLFKESENLKLKIKKKLAYRKKDELIYRLLGNCLLEFIGNYEPKLEITENELVEFQAIKINFSFGNVLSIQKTILNLLHILSSKESTKNAREIAFNNFDLLELAIGKFDSFLFGVIYDKGEFRTNENYLKVYKCFKDMQVKIKERRLYGLLSDHLKGDQDINELNAKHKKLKKEFDVLEEQVRESFLSIRIEKDASIKEIEMYENLIKKQEFEINQFKEQSKKLKNENFQLKKQNANAKKKLARLKKRRKSDLKAKMNSLKKLEQKVKTKNKEVQNQVDQLTLNEQELDVQLELLKSKLEKNIILMSELDVEINTLGNQIQKIKKNILECKAKFHSEKKENQRLIEMLRGNSNESIMLREKIGRLEMKKEEVSHYLYQDPRDTPENESLIRQIHDLSGKMNQLKISPQVQNFNLTLNWYRNEINKEKLHQQDLLANMKKLSRLEWECKNELNDRSAEFLTQNPSQLLIRNGSVIQNENIYRVCQTRPIRMCVLLGEYLAKQRELNSEHFQAIEGNINRIHRLAIHDYLRALGLVFNRNIDRERLESLFNKHYKIIRGLFPFVKEFPNEMVQVKPIIINNIMSIEYVHTGNMENIWGNLGLKYLSVLLVSLGKAKYTGCAFNAVFFSMCEIFNLKFKGDFGEYRGVEPRKKIQQLLLNDFAQLFDKLLPESQIKDNGKTRKVSTDLK